MAQVTRHSHHSFGVRLFPLRTEKWVASPLCHAALCWFHDLIGPLIVRHPQQVNACGGYYYTPLVAALGGELLPDHRVTPARCKC